MANRSFSSSSSGVNSSEESATRGSPQPPQQRQRQYRDPYDAVARRVLTSRGPPAHPTTAPKRRPSTTDSSIHTLSTPRLAADLNTPRYPTGPSTHTTLDTPRYAAGDATPRTKTPPYGQSHLTNYNSAANEPAFTPRDKVPCLEPKGGYTVVFDLDETLIHHPWPNVVHKRAYLEDLLRGLKGRCELVLWTASTRAMGIPALRAIDPEGEFFDRVIFRDPAWFHDTARSSYHKDLKYLGRPLSSTIIIENTPNSVRFNKENAIIVPDFLPHPHSKQHPDDKVLLTVSRCLHDLLDSRSTVPDFLASHHLVEQVALYRKNSYGIPLRNKPPGVFYYLRV
ncbi:putative C-terminal domain small phosphatase [Diplonema papillatum]|nr:putative C-terminal domain small phosphatase [Diplonema papillatum]